ncbi:sigma factor [Actinoallomurus sp. NPDC050550]|uniref:sigma factor n=1 Tax=Actinoallomurus sp. NPDC050550 TaxID=3154937 RepID=UPI0033D324B2
MSNSDEFTRLTDPFRPELPVHCYRMLGSIHDAEDLARETYLRAWRAYENFEGRSSLRRLLRDDVALEMPPNATWFTGRATVGRFIAAKVFAGPGVTRMVRVTANGQPAAAVYRRTDDGVHRAHAVQVLSITDTGISRIISFNDPGLFRAFGLPVTLDAAGVPASA